MVMRFPLIVLAVVAFAAAAPPRLTAAPATGPATRPAWTSVAFADPGPATRVVFVCEASGSMRSKFASLKEELAKAVNALGPDQSFDLIFLHDEEPLALDGRSPVPASDENKRRAARFLDDATMTGTSDPIAGLRLAFRQRPDVVYLLADGDFPNNQAVMESVRRLNRAARARVNTVAFINDKDTDTDFNVLLKSVARENGGSFRTVDQDWLVEPRRSQAQGLLYGEIPPVAVRRPVGAKTRPATGPVLPDLARFASIVIVCDPSLGAGLPAARQAVERAVLGLRPEQSFGIVFLREKSPDAMSETRLFLANDTRKAQAVRFVREEPAAEGEVDSAPGVTIALGLRPEAIVLVSNAWFPHPDYALGLIADSKLVRDAALHFVEIVSDEDSFVTPEQYDPLCEATKRVGGTFRRVDVGSSAP